VPSPPLDFATIVGPRLLVGTGALAFVVFVGLFVKYAWENDWIGPAGRVLCGAIFGLALVALGVRLLGREYRPLGQGLAGAGLASLYLSAYGAHGFYDLVSREVAGALMLAITVNAVLLAARLQARLLATLAWTGAYLTPVLLSTGEDRAVSTCSCSTPAPSSSTGGGRGRRRCPWRCSGLSRSTSHGLRASSGVSASTWRPSGWFSSRPCSWPDRAGAPTALGGRPSPSSRAASA
jgi:hypothetical protein